MASKSGADAPCSTGDQMWRGGSLERVERTSKACGRSERGAMAKCGASNFGSDQCGEIRAALQCSLQQSSLSAAFCRSSGGTLARMRAIRIGLDCEPLAPQNSPLPAAGIARQSALASRQTTSRPWTRFRIVAGKVQTGSSAGSVAEPGECRRGAILPIACFLLRSAAMKTTVSTRKLPSKAAIQRALVVHTLDPFGC